MYQNIKHNQEKKILFDILGYTWNKKRFKNKKYVDKLDKDLNHYVNLHVRGLIIMEKINLTQYLCWCTNKGIKIADDLYDKEEIINVYKKMFKM